MLRTLFALTGDQLFLAVLDHSLSMLPVMAAVIAARWLLRGLPRRLTTALWLVVFLRLLLPVTVESPLGLVSQEPVIAPAAAPGVEVSLPAALEAAQRTVGDTLSGRIESVSVQTSSGAQLLGRSQVWLVAGSWLWLAGMAALALYSLLSLLRLRRQLVGAARLPGDIWLCDEIDTPFILGVLRPRICLPSHLEERDQAAILAHEHAHIRHLDPAVRLLAWVGVCVHWFDPVVWLCFQLMTADMEAACDEAAADLPPDRRADYADTLLRLSTGHRHSIVSPLAFGEGDPKDRIRRVLSFQKPGTALCLAAAVLVAALGVCLVTQRSREPHLPGRIYLEEELLYQAPGAESSHLPNLAIVSDDRLLAFSSSVPDSTSSPTDLFSGLQSGTWGSVGQLRSTQLTRKELMLLFPSDDGWTTTWRPAQLTDIRYLQREDGLQSLCLFLQTSAGDTLLALGERTVTGGEIRYLYRLCPSEPVYRNSDGATSYAQLDVIFQLRQRGLHPQFLSQWTTPAPYVGTGCLFQSKEEGGLGFATWQRDEGGYYRLIGLHYYSPEELADCQLAPGCYLAPDPMLNRPNDPGVTLHDYNTSDVLFICNEAVLRVDQTITSLDGAVSCTTSSEYVSQPSYPNHLTFRWDDLRQRSEFQEGYTIRYRFFDRAGNEIS